MLHAQVACWDLKCDACSMQRAGCTSWSMALDRRHTIQSVAWPLTHTSYLLVRYVEELTSTADASTCRNAANSNTVTLSHAHAPHLLACPVKVARLMPSPGAAAAVKEMLIVLVLYYARQGGLVWGMPPCDLYPAF